MQLTVQEISKLIGAKVANQDEIKDQLDTLKVARLGDLSGSTSDSVAFFFSHQYKNDLLSAAPGVLITGNEFVGPMRAAGIPIWKKSVILACEDPYRALGKLSERFASEQKSSTAKIHESVVIDPSAKIGEGVEMGPHAVVAAHATVGDGSVLMAGSYVGEGTTLGKGVTLFPNAIVYDRCEIGDQTRIHSGTVIGADGFGYAPIKGEDGKPKGHQKIYHLGRVRIGSNVEIGANSCVDRGTIGDTVIGDHVKIDNLVQVAHNCIIGDGAVLCGRVGLAGSVTIGKFAYLGGAAGLSNGVKIGDYAKVGAGSGLMKDVAPGASVIGAPAVEPGVFFRMHAYLTRAVTKKRKPARESKSEPRNGKDSQK